MAARGSKGTQQARTHAERARVHAARRAWHDHQIRRRVRDNAIAAVAGSLLVVAAIGSQFVHAQVAAPAPTPTPTVAPDETPAPDPTTSPDPLTSPEPTPTAPPAG